jgi:hypothetical protein
MTRTVGRDNRVSGDHCLPGMLPHL